MAGIPDRLGDVQILTVLGTGGMGEVFLGRRQGPGGFSRAVVVKRLLPHLARDAAIRSMFLDEARIAARIRHRNIVQVQELRESGGDLFFTMEYLEGESLGQLVSRMVSAKRHPPYRPACYIMSEVSAGLLATHSLADGDGKLEGVVHRDVKLSNIFVTYDGQVKLLDFGIAKADRRLYQTQTGAIRGTRGYTSPEQITNEDVDLRSDIFSFGIVLYEVTTLRRLFRRPTQHTTYQAILSDPILPPWKIIPDYPERLGEIVMKCLQRRPEDRYQDCRTLRSDLHEVLDELPGTGSPVDGASRLMVFYFSKRIQRHRAMLDRLERGDSRDQVVDGMESDDLVADDDVEGLPVPLQGTTSSMARPFEAPGGHTSGWLSRKAGRIRIAWALPVLAALVGLVIGWMQTHVRGDKGEGPTTSPIRETAGATGAPRPGVTPPSVLRQLTVQSKPAGAMVSIGDKGYGRTPIAFDWPPNDGPTELVLSLAGYAKQAVTVSPDSSSHVFVVLQNLASPSDVTPDAKPTTQGRKARKRSHLPRPSSRPARGKLPDDPPSEYQPFDEIE